MMGFHVGTDDSLLSFCRFHHISSSENWFPFLKWCLKVLQRVLPVWQSVEIQI